MKRELSSIDEFEYLYAVPDMGTNKKGGKSHSPVKRKHEDSLVLVSPGDSGKGLPYAPEDWPNPGDVWEWRVGRRTNSKGVYQDRFLTAPERLQDKPTKKLTFPSKLSLERYLQSAFPETDINAFFALFTWEISAKNESSSKGESVPYLSPPTAQEEGETNGNAGSKRARRAGRKKKVEVSTGDDGRDLSIDFFSPEGAASRASGTTSFANGHSGTNGSPVKSQSSFTPVEFESYLNCLDEILTLPLPIDEPSSHNKSAFEVRKTLSSLLAMGFTSLVSSNKVDELVALTSKLQSDPSLSSKELAMLKLIEEIPFTSKCFLEAKEVSLQADKFFADLDAKLTSVASLKEEYDTAKAEIEAVQADESNALLNILDIDQQIANLQSRKQALSETAKAISRKINELASTQKRVMDSLPKIVQEVQMANSEKSGWELKRQKAAEQEAEILAKFAPLEGFSF